MTGGMPAAAVAFHRLCGFLSSAFKILLEFHYDVYACRNFQLLKSLSGLLCRTDYIDQSLMGTTLELLTAVLVLVCCTQDCDDLLIGRERDRTRNLRTASLCSFYNLRCCCVNSRMLITLDLDSDFFVDCHSFRLLCILGAGGCPPSGSPTLPGVPAHGYKNNS